MYYQPYYHRSSPQPIGYYEQHAPVHPYEQRQQPTVQELSRRLAEVERINEVQGQEITRQNDEIGRINNEIKRINEEIRRLNTNDELHTGRLTRLNQRLRVAENRLNIPYTGGTDGF